MAKSKAPLYAVVDIETTGGLAKRDKIIEIAIIVTNGNEIIREFSSLVNPQRSISYEITRITGIDDGMVRDAPKFYEIAKDIVLTLEGTIFVAHNVNFDYSFIREEFDKLGYTFSKRQLCTVKLTRKTFPGISSYSLGNLITYFDILVQARHRAYDDALATLKIFHLILQQESSPEHIKFLVNKGIRDTKLPEAISLERLHALPESTGVYYFYDAYGTVIYVGKSVNIRSRLMQHFGQITAKSEKLMRRAYDIDYTETGSELIALLLESEEIKTLHPEINRAQKNQTYPFIIYTTIDYDGYQILGVEKVNTKPNPKHKILSYYSSISGAKGKLAYMRELFQLCESKLEIGDEKNKRCIYFNMGECLGACKGEESALEYNYRAGDAVETLTKVFDENFVIITQGRSAEEAGLVLIENNTYRGFGFMPKDDLSRGIEEIKEAIEMRYTSPEANMIIHQYLKQHTDYKLLYF
jgi:DNA polymerase III subunit epsilon